MNNSPNNPFDNPMGLYPDDTFADDFKRSLETVRSIYSQHQHLQPVLKCVCLKEDQKYVDVIIPLDDIPRAMNEIIPLNDIMQAVKGINVDQRDVIMCALGSLLVMNKLVPISAFLHSEGVLTKNISDNPDEQIEPDEQEIQIQALLVESRTLDGRAISKIFELRTKSDNEVLLFDLMKRKYDEFEIERNTEQGITPLLYYFFTGVNHAIYDIIKKLKK